jgi:hypothetical protein
VLLEADVRFPGDASRIGIDGLKKALDLSLYLLFARGRHLPRLDWVLNFPLHPYSSTELDALPGKPPILIFA